MSGPSQDERRNAVYAVEILAEMRDMMRNTAQQDQQTQSDLQQIRDEVRNTVSNWAYELEHGQAKSVIHHLIKEAVNVAITEVITQERDQDESFFGFLHRRKHERSTNSDAARVDLANGSSVVFDPGDGSPASAFQGTEDPQVTDAPPAASSDGSEETGRRDGAW